MTKLSSKAQTSDLDNSFAQKVRHTVSAGLSFINAAVENLGGHKPDTLEALRMYDVGKGKIGEAIVDLDKLIHNQPTTAIDLGYNGTVETTFTANHDEVVKWTHYFEKQVSESYIFSEFEGKNPRSRERALVVASLWHRFSAFMPWFLCQAAAMVSTNEKRHYVIQTAYEELGMRDAREIHPDMFWSAAELAGSNLSEREKVESEERPKTVLNTLRQTLLSYTSDEEVLGILLGLEIPAQENIATVFLSLAHTDELFATLNKHKFFQLHREIETEHVRLTVANFLRFCETDEQKEKFNRGFQDGLKFWRSFWDTASESVLLKTQRERPLYA